MLHDVSFGLFLWIFIRCMSTYVGDPLYIVSSFLRWRDIIQSQRVNKEWYRRLKIKDRNALRKLARHLPEDISTCRINGSIVWHPLWDGPYWVWTPPFDAYKLVQYGQDLSFPVNLTQDWMLWIMGLKRHLGIQRAAKFVRGKRQLMHQARKYRALISFRVRKNVLLFKIVRLQPLGPIYKRARRDKCATRIRG